MHKDTLGQLYHGSNLHFELFGQHQRFVTAGRGIDLLRNIPEEEWRIEQGTFVLYHLFPNIQFLTSKSSSTLIRIYPHPEGAGHSVTQISFYFTEEFMQKAAENGQLKEIIFGRNEPALHHFHSNYREALGQPPLEVFS